MKGFNEKMKRNIKFWIILVLILSIIVTIMALKQNNNFKVSENNIENQEEIIIEESIENIIKEDIGSTDESKSIEKNEIITEEKVSIKNNNTIKSVYNENKFKEGYLATYPEYGTKYGTLKINSIGINAPVYFGVTNEIILKGIGHDSGSYFPGEGGSIIMCEHNYMNKFNEVDKIKMKDIIEITTNYGDFYYKVYDKQVLSENEKEKLIIQKEKEILMIYTCYPLNNVEHTEYRYVIWAEKC